MANTSHYFHLSSWWWGAERRQMWVSEIQLREIDSSGSTKSTKCPNNCQLLKVLITVSSTYLWHFLSCVNVREATLTVENWKLPVPKAAATRWSSRLFTLAAQQIYRSCHQKKRITLSTSLRKTLQFHRGRGELNMTCTVILWIPSCLKTCEQPSSVWSSFSTFKTSSGLQMQQMCSEKRRKTQPSVRIFIQALTSFTFEGLAVSQANRKPLKSRINTGCAWIYGFPSAIQHSTYRVVYNEIIWFIWMACFSSVTFVKYSVIKISDIVYFCHLHFQFSFQVALHAALLEEDLLKPAVLNRQGFKV